MMTAAAFEIEDFGTVPVPDGFTGVSTIPADPTEYLRTLQVDGESVAIVGVTERHPGVG